MSFGEKKERIRVVGGKRKGVCKWHDSVNRFGWETSIYCFVQRKIKWSHTSIHPSIRQLTPPTSLIWPLRFSTFDLFPPDKHHTTIMHAAYNVLNSFLINTLKPFILSHVSINHHHAPTLPFQTTMHVLTIYSHPLYCV